MLWMVRTPKEIGRKKMKIVVVVVDGEDAVEKKKGYARDKGTKKWFERWGHLKKSKEMKIAVDGEDA